VDDIMLPGGFTVYNGTELAGVYSIKTPLSNLAVGTHTIIVYYAQDTVGNVSQVLTGTFTSVGDTTPPTVVSITASAYNKFRVRFSENVLSSDGNQFNNNNFAIAKGNSAFSSAEFSVVNNPDNDGSLSLYEITMLNNNAYNPLYGSGESTVSLTVMVKNYKDTASYMGSAYTGTVTLGTDATAPYVVLSNLNNVTGNVVAIQFNEPLAAISVDTSKITIKTYDNIIIPVAAAYTTGNYLYISLNTTAYSTPSLLVNLKAGTVTDTSGNANAEYTNGSASSSGGSTTTATLIMTPLVSVVGNTIHLAFAYTMGQSAVNIANYTLEGAAFPLGTIIGFVSDKCHVEIILPKNTIASTAQMMFTISKNVVSYDGNYYVADSGGAAYTSFPVLIDNVSPVVQSAKFVLNNSEAITSNQIVVTFSEMLANVSNADFGLYVNDTKVDLLSNAVINGKTVTFTIPIFVNVSQAFRLKVLPIVNGDGRSAIQTYDTSPNQNLITTGTIVNVTK
jgi:hypothetical protein